jgi:transglutaminase-like putative cysteine protease
MRLTITALLDYVIRDEADVLLQVEVAGDASGQNIIASTLTATGGALQQPMAIETSFGQQRWVRGAGPLRLDYEAVVELDRPSADLAGRGAIAHPDLPSAAVPYLLSSRYCQPDRFESFVAEQFGALNGGDKIAAMADWIHTSFDYVPGSSNSETSAFESFEKRKGVCRDYAHVLIAMARAVGIPARMVSCYAWQLEREDFHAVAEVWLEGGWHSVDPTRMAPGEGLARIVAGRDATDISFMTIFGRADLRRQTVRVTRVD